MKRDAAWLLRRYRDGGALDWQVRLVLEREFNRLIAEQYELRAEVDEFRRVAPERLRKFDEATDRALQWKAERRFEDALREIQRAAVELSELRRLVKVAAELDQASGTVRGIESLLGPSLTGLTTPGILRRLRSLARQLLDQGQARKARFVVLLLTSQADRLQSRAQCKPSSGLTLTLDELIVQGGDEAVEALRKLVREGYFHLAERLAEDLEVELGLRDRSRRAAQSPGDLEAILHQADAVRTSMARWLDSVS